MNPYDPRTAAAFPDPTIGSGWDEMTDWPAWARIHIPMEPLIEENPVRSTRKLPLPALALRKRATQASLELDKTDELPIVTTTVAPTIGRVERLHVKRGLLTMAAGVTIAVVSGAIGVALASPASHSDPQAQALPTPPPKQPADIPVAQFCPDRTEGTSVTTSGPGTTSTPAGVIAAFDYAYYSLRDGQKVADLMVTPPNSVPVIQSAIDAVPEGTRACVTTRPSENALVFLVDVRLDYRTGSDGALSQRITVAKSGTGYKIALVEDR